MIDRNAADAGEPDVLVPGGGLRARAVALAREAEDGDDGEEEVQVLAREPSHVLARVVAAATQRSADSSARRRGRARTRAGTAGAGAGATEEALEAGGERRVRGGGRIASGLAAHRARHGRERT